MVPWNEILREWLQENGFTILDLADALDCRWAVAHRLAYDDIPMTAPLAENLATITGIKPSFWMRLDEMYRLTG
jgi:plasmid maintenance system antidote protein VapI